LSLKLCFVSFFYCVIRSLHLQHVCISASVFIDKKVIREMVILANFQSYCLLKVLYLCIARLSFHNNYLRPTLPVDHLSPCDPTHIKWIQTDDSLLRNSEELKHGSPCLSNVQLKRWSGHQCLPNHHKIQICFTRMKSASSSGGAHFYVSSYTDAKQPA